MRWIDSHAHLDDRAFDQDRAGVITRCADEKMGIITIGSSLHSSKAGLRLARRYRNMWATVGVHPHDAKALDDATLGELKKLAQDELVVGIGEIGLDYYRDLSPRDRQRSAFERQLALAADVGLPICLHNRESTDDFLAVLRAAGSQHRGVVHSFLGDRELAETFMALGLYLGVGGPLTYSKNETLREAVKTIPLDRMLLETDCPYLTPVPYRGKRNEPVYVAYVAQEIARIKGISVDDVAHETTRNAMLLFGLTDS